MRSAAGHPGALLRLLTAVLAPCLAGCPRCPETSVPLEQLVAEYNANAQAVPQLWARAKIAVTLIDEKKGTFSFGSTSPLAAPNARLMLAKPEGVIRIGPSDFVLIGYEASQEVFRLGNSLEAGQYYLWFRYGDRAGLWWGRTELAGAPGVRGLPIDPTQLLAVLCVCDLPADFTQPPTVALSMSTEPCAYVVTYIDRQPVTGRLLFRREMYFRWDDKEPRLPFKVNFFDGEGRRIMTADVRNYRPIDPAGSEPPPRQPPVMPTEIDVAWFDAQHQPKGKLSLVLSEMTTRRKWQRKVCLPPDAADLPAGKVIQVDKDVPTGGPIK